MDTLRAYFKSLSKDERETFAKEVGTSVAYVWQIIYGQRRCKEGLAIEISKATHGAVPLMDLRPDVDWDYVRQSAEAVATDSSVVDREAASDDAQPPVGTVNTEEGPHGSIVFDYSERK